MSCGIPNCTAMAMKWEQCIPVSFPYAGSLNPSSIAAIVQ